MLTPGVPWLDFTRWGLCSQLVAAHHLNSELTVLIWGKKGQNFWLLPHGYSVLLLKCLRSADANTLLQ